jgi:hypothetical protein
MDESVCISVLGRAAFKAFADHAAQRLAFRLHLGVGARHADLGSFAFHPYSAATLGVLGSLPGSGRFFDSNQRLSRAVIGTSFIAS